MSDDGKTEYFRERRPGVLNAPDIQPVPLAWETFETVAIDGRTSETVKLVGVRIAHPSGEFAMLMVDADWEKFIDAVEVARRQSRTGIRPATSLPNAPFDLSELLRRHPANGHEPPV